MNNTDVGRFISECRKEKGFTQKELAEKLSVTDKAVSKWETGRSAPDISLLMSLSEILDVTVTEILQGERIQKESFPEISDAVIVKTIKNGNRKLKRAVLTAIASMLILICMAVLSYPAYHFFTSVPIDDDNAIIKCAERDKNIFNKDGEDMKIIKRLKKANYYFYLMQTHSQISLYMFEKNKLFEDRISLFLGDTNPNEPNKIYKFQTSGKGPTTVSVFYGYDMTDESYSYRYRGNTKITKEIEEEILLDALLEVDDTYAGAVLVDNDYVLPVSNP